MILKHACGLDLEGIVSKRKDAPYRSGRSENFIKSKCHNAQEFVVAGYSPASADPHAVGALTVAVHDNGELRYAGRVGTGYTRKTARELWQRLKSLKIDKPPLTLPKDERRKDVIWVKPQLVIEAEFRGVTHGNVLRQASFKGLREDKPAREVVREVPVGGDGAAAGGAKVGKDNGNCKRRQDATQSRRSAPRQARAGADVGNVHLTHPDRVYWADVGVTKEDLAEYYVSVWDWMAPHVVDRPLAWCAARRASAARRFFQKHIAANVKDSPLRHPVDAKEHDVIAVEKLDDVIALVQSGALEIHVRGSRLEQLELCDRIVFDLDPGDGVSWKEIVAAAREMRERLEALKLKASSSCPAARASMWWCRSPAPIGTRRRISRQRIALGMAADSPQRYVGKMTKSLRKGKIFIDYFRNSREATSVAPYSTRARPGAAVSAPLSWEAARPHQERRRIHRAQSEKALQARPLGRHRQGAAEVAGEITASPRELEALRLRLESRAEDFRVQRILEAVADEGRVIVFDIHVEFARHS